MSSFRGVVAQFPGLSIDRFDGENLQSTTYVLSHCHKDHMVGLSSRQFYYHACSHNVTIYVTPLSQLFLVYNEKAAYRKLKNYLKPIDYNAPTVVNIGSRNAKRTEDNFVMTFLESAHCPGACMVLMESAQGNVLYTGDFRLSVAEFKRLSLLHRQNDVKQLDALHIDTTFCVPSAEFIPSREASLEVLSELVASWISHSDEHIVSLHFGASLGYEHVMEQLFYSFNQKVHVSHRQHLMYSRIPELCMFTTSDANTQLHACGYGMCSSSSSTVRHITLSTMYFVHSVSHSRCVQKTAEGAEFYRVCYSFHPSLSEVRDVIKYLQPREVFANVAPSFAGESLHEVQERIRRYLPQNGEETVNKKLPVVSLGALKTRTLDDEIMVSQGDLLFCQFAEREGVLESVSAHTNGNLEVMKEKLLFYEATCDDSGCDILSDTDSETVKGNAENESVQEGDSFDTTPRNCACSQHNAHSSRDAHASLCDAYGMNTVSEGNTGSCVLLSMGSTISTSSDGVSCPLTSHNSDASVIILDEDFVTHKTDVQMIELVTSEDEDTVEYDLRQLSSNTICDIITIDSD